MKEHINSRAYDRINTKIHIKDQVQRMKIRIPKKYLIPAETIPVKNNMRRKKNSVAINKQEMEKESIENLRN